MFSRKNKYIFVDKKKKRRQKILTALIALLLICGIVVGGFFAWNLITDSHSQKQTKKAVEKTATKQAENKQKSEAKDKQKTKATEKEKAEKSKNNKDKNLKKISKISHRTLSEGESFKTAKGFTAVMNGGVLQIYGVPIINKSFNVPDGYAQSTDRETNVAFENMRIQASKEGISIAIYSSYRGREQQQALYNSGRKSPDGKDYIAKAGYSENQAGLAIDLATWNPEFGETPAGKWINDNCYKFGFIIRYPRGHEKYTGYPYEPWHIRYVGNDLARKLYNSGNWISMEKYFGIPSKYPE